MTVNGSVDRRRPDTRPATAAKRRQGAHTAARELTMRVEALSDKDLLDLANALIDEMEQRDLSYELLGLEAL